MVSLETRKKQYREIYEMFNRNPRIYVKTVASRLRVDPATAGRRIKEAIKDVYVSFPQIRKRSFLNTKEYVYFANCERPLKSFREYKEDTRVVFHARMSGFSNLWITSKEETSIKGHIMASGPRSDYHVAYAPNYSWKKAIEIVEKKVETSNPEEYEQKETIKINWNEPIEWGPKDEILLGEFKYNLRKKLSPIMRKHKISAKKIYEFLDRMYERCTVFTRYFPETISNYDPYLFMFETDYEDFIVDLFSGLPTSSFFFKVSNKLFFYTNVDKSYTRYVGLRMSDMNKLRIPLIAEDLFDRGIIKDEAKYAIVEYSWAKDL